MSDSTSSPLLRPASVEDLLLYRLARVVAAAGTPVLRLCEGRFGITRREWRILALLAEHGALPPSSLADTARLDRARTSRALSTLIGKGLVHRAADHVDRRRAQVSLTGAGRELHGQLFPLVAGFNRELLATLAAHEVDVLDAVLGRLERHATQLARRDGQPKADRRRGRRRAGA